MADFDPAYETMIRNEGGYRLTSVSNDRGGQTFAGISRNYHPQWPGWRYIDAKDLGNADLTDRVIQFYKEQFWNALGGDQLEKQAIAASIFDFAVNAGVATAVKLAQLVVNETPDGVLGPITLATLNQADPERFVMQYALAKIARYAEICRKDPAQQKFLLGWINRTLRGLS